MYPSTDSNTILAALLGLICLVVFFIMAGRLGAIKKNTDYLKAYFKEKARAEGMVKTIECTNPNCKQKTNYISEPPERCFKCNTILPKA